MSILDLNSDFKGRKMLRSVKFRFLIFSVNVAATVVIRRRINTISVPLPSTNP
jgi:hypothetical protein